MGVLSDWMSRIAAEAEAAREVPFLTALAEAFPDGELGEIAMGPGRCDCFRGRVGKFTYTAYQVAILPAAEAGMVSVRTALAIEFPTVEGLAFEIRKDTCDVEPNSLMEEFLFGISAWFSCDELKALIHERDFLGHLHGLLSQRLGEIDCGARHFQAIVEEEICGTREALRFVGNALRIFQRFARSAHLATPAWRAPAFGHDWWLPLDLPQVDEVLPDDLSSERVEAYLKRNYALPGQAESLAEDSGPRQIDPKAFVLCSSCLTDLDETRVDCPACGAGHHWTCAVGRCGECGAPLERCAQPPSHSDEMFTGAGPEGEALPERRHVPAHAAVGQGDLAPRPALPSAPADGAAPASDRGQGFERG